MNYGLYLSASGAKAQLDRQAVITNNLANAQTTGFKRDLVNMQSRLNAAYEDPTMSAYRLPVYKDQGGGVFATSGGIDLTQASFSDTRDPTDFALSGSGFFTIAGDNGQTLLTRDGRFMVDPTGHLLTRSGGNRPVLNSTGQPIVVDPNLPISVASDGAISQNGQDLGIKLGMTDVANPRQLVKLGGNLLRTTGQLAATGQDTQILQGKLEDSGVEPMVEMVNMMEGQRAFDANAKMISFQDTTLSQLNTVGRVA